MTIVPSSRPQQPREKTEDLLGQAGVDLTTPALLGVRGYYRDTMGEAGVNDRAIYDDAVMLISPEAYVTFNANCDPGAFKKGIATLKAGLWKYKVGIHGLNKPPAKRYTALVQAEPVTVIRDQIGEDTGWLGINIHRGGMNSVSSLGCQTIFPKQWEAFITLVQEELKRAGAKIIPYLLIEHQG
jgi:lysozyme